MKRLYYSVLVILAAVGAVAVGVRLSEGLRVTALTSPIAWGMWVAFYIYFIGLSAGSFLLSTLVYVFGMKRYERTGRMALLSALFALAGGLLFVWIDLGHPMRFWHVFKTPNFRSVLAWEMYLYLLYIVLILGELWLLLRGDLARLAQRGSGWRRSLYGFLTLGYRPSPDPEERERRAKRDLRWVKVLGIIGVPT
ncbi:MAG: NrfD/PsrC family molybdoenzyme membrane anchor subunit, partial [Nitrospinota bacterium]